MRISDVIVFLRDLGDQDIDQHLRECSNCATYEASVDKFLKCLSKHLGDFRLIDCST